MTSPVQIWDPARIWDEWRARTATMTYLEQQAFYDIVTRNWPEQAHFDRPTAEKELGGIAPKDVLELGGWRGDLAAFILSSDAGRTIHQWVNVDIAPQLVSMQRCEDIRYRLVIPQTWFWKTTIEDVFDCAVATHFIEHLTLEQFILILEKLRCMEKVKTIYFESPLTETGEGWAGYYGSHILPIGWGEVRRLIEVGGWRVEQVSALVCVGRR